MHLAGGLDALAAAACLPIPALGVSPPTPGRSVGRGELRRPCGAEHHGVLTICMERGCEIGMRGAEAREGGLLMAGGGGLAHRGWVVVSQAARSGFGGARRVWLELVGYVICQSGDGHALAAGGRAWGLEGWSFRISARGISPTARDSQRCSGCTPAPAPPVVAPARSDLIPSQRRWDCPRSRLSLA